MSSGRPVYAFFGHHKCATRWINSILRRVCKELGFKLSIVWTADLFDGDLQNYVEKNQIDFISYTNADYRYVRDLKNIRGFHVVRDPRDVINSGYFSHLKSHETKNWPELVAHRANLQSLPKEEGMMVDMAWIKRYMDEMAGWDYDAPNIYQTRMETITRNPYVYFMDVFDYLGLLDDSKRSMLQRGVESASRRVRDVSGGRVTLPTVPEKLPPESFLRAFWDNDFARKSGGRKKGQENQASHYRKGISGDWRNHWQAKHIAYFKANYNDVLLQLGYEDTPDWV